MCASVFVFFTMVNVLPLCCVVYDLGKRVFRWRIYRE